MTAISNAWHVERKEGRARATKLAALGLGVSLFATACAGGGGTSGGTGGTETTAAGSGLSCPEGAASSAAATAAKGDPGAVPKAKKVSDKPLKLGSLLPTTGTLAFLGPPEIAGVNLGIKEINAAGGVLGKPVSAVHRDSGDTTTDIATQSVTALLGQNVNAIIGAASSGVSKTVINQITRAGVVQFSPANTSPEFTDWNDNNLYWRTAPSDVLQGRVLGNYMVSCGAQTVGMIVLNDAYGTGLQANIKTAFEGAGGQVVAESMFNEGDSQFSSQVDAVVAKKPDAYALISFDQAKSIIPLLLEKGVTPDQLFLVDGNTSDYSEDLDPGALAKAQGTIPGTFAKDDFKKALAEVDPNLKSWAYAAESYDAVNLVALAAEAAGSVEGKAISSKLQDVSRDGEKCGDFASCVTLLREGKNIDYDGVSGPVTFSPKGDPTEAFIGIYEYDDKNVPQPSREEFGEL